MSHQPPRYSGASPRLAALKSRLQTARLALSFPKLPGVIFRIHEWGCEPNEDESRLFPLDGTHNGHLVWRIRVIGGGLIVCCACNEAKTAAESVSMGSSTLQRTFVCSAFVQQREVLLSSGDATALTQSLKFCKLFFMGGAMCYQTQWHRAITATPTEPSVIGAGFQSARWPRCESRLIHVHDEAFVLNSTMPEWRMRWPHFNSFSPDQHLEGPWLKSLPCVRANVAQTCNLDHVVIIAFNAIQLRLLLHTAKHLASPTLFNKS